MKIEVTHSWTQGASSHTVTVSVDMALIQPATAEEVAEFAEALKQVGEDGKRATEVAVNVFVDGARVAAQKEVTAQSKMATASLDGRDRPFDNSDDGVRKAAQAYDADAELGRMVRNMPEEAKLWRDLDGKWNMTGDEANTYLCSSPEDALKLGGVKP